MEIEQEWAVVRGAIEKMQNIVEGKPETSFTSEEYMQIYTVIYHLTNRLQSGNDFAVEMNLYQRYRGSLEKYLTEIVLPALTEKRNEFMLAEFFKRFKNHLIMVRWLTQLFGYLERCFLCKHRLPTLRDSGLFGFRDLVYNAVKIKARDICLEMIDGEREGKQQINDNLIRQVMRIFIGMGKKRNDTFYYDNDFENELLNRTADYYSRQAALWIVENTCPEYMQKAEDSLTKEMERANRFLLPRTAEKIAETVRNELLCKFPKQILEMEGSGLLDLLREGKTTDLSRMFNLFVMIPHGLEPVAKMFKHHVMEEGMCLVKELAHANAEKNDDKIDMEVAQVFSNRLIKLHDKFMSTLTECFISHGLFEMALKEGFEHFCNLRVADRNTSELLAVFSDSILKKGGGEKLSDEETESLHKNIALVLEYIYDKDMFANLYIKLLAGRLLFQKSLGNDHELGIIMKLKQQCGSHFTLKMERMIRDMTVAKQNQEAFEDYLNENAQVRLSIDFNVIVLTAGLWPSYGSLPLDLPHEMVKCVEEFKGYFEKTKQNRQLTWIYTMGNCHIVGMFKENPVELIVTPCQASALLLFNERTRISYSEIKAQLNLSDKDATMVLSSLSCAKYKILLKTSSNNIMDGSDIMDDSDCFEVNDKFTLKKRRINIPLAPVEEKKKVVHHVNQERNHAVDACIVRIMKSRNILPYEQLVEECIQQLKAIFRPDAKIIKKRIEDLIEREFLVRNEDNPNIFKYVA